MPTDQERIERLEDVVDDLGKSVEELERRFKADIEDLKESILDEESSRTNEDTSLSDRLDNVEE